jgi:hypothetical protein
MNFTEELLFLTPKGTEELRSRAHRLDFPARNILFLIQQGFSTAEAILQRTIFPPDAVMDRLGRLLGNKFVAVAPGAVPASTAKPSALARTPPAPDPGLEVPVLSPLSAGIAPSQARFALSDFCLEVFGTQGQGLVDAVDSCADVPSLQQLLNRIGREVQIRSPDRLSALADCVRGINETDPDAPATTGTPIQAGQTAAPEHWQLIPGASFTQARFALSEFCLDHFGVRGQTLVSAVNGAGSLDDLEQVLASIRLEVAARCPDRMPVLWDCIQGINGTSP